jgi:chromate transport protein ChrA
MVLERVAAALTCLEMTRVLSILTSAVEEDQHVCAVVMAHVALLATTASTMQVVVVGVSWTVGNVPGPVRTRQNRQKRPFAWAA